jgi:integrase
MAKLNFTKASIESLPIPQKGWKYHYDLKVQGLGIGVGNTGKKSFILYRKINGIPERITLGRYPDLTIEQARCKASDINSDIANGLNPAEIKRSNKEEMTLGELFAEYLERYALPHNKKTVPDMRNNFRRYLGKWENRKLSNISKKDIEKLHYKLGKKIGAHTANRTLELLRSILNKAIAWGLFSKVNPVVGIEKFSLKSRDRFLHADELPRFFKALGEEPNEIIRDYVLLSLLTGARKANMLAMQWADVNLDRAEWYIQETKNGTSQTVTLSPEAVDILRNRKLSESTIFVFPGEGKSGHLIEPKKGWKRILERAGIVDLRIHDLRRTLGSWQAKTGASLAIIGKSLNHKNQNTTAIYARLDLDPIRESVNTATSAMMEAAGLKKTADVVPLQSKR